MLYTYNHYIRDIDDYRWLLKRYNETRCESGFQRYIYRTSQPSVEGSIIDTKTSVFF
ncbi:Uncharacterized protein APZ42_031809 [Daphnia magna]|uniref:Uncharacterized protein n=1 Tax=Daphnia magna TaxID=35525 RepID=A0A0N8DVP4_9CRUS|nr:Uncharacterized protein APZ42_031809 [Daphnia magna]